jgi:hypothetical protein
MKSSTTFFIGVIAVLATLGARAESPGAACALLTQADIDAVTGAKSGQGHPMDQDIAGAAGQHVTAYACLWPLPGASGQMLASIGPLPPGQTAKSLNTKNPGVDALRAQHYTEESKDFGDINCGAYTAPASVKDGLGMTFCAAGRSGKVVSVTYMSPAKKLSIEQAKALIDKALARVH